MRQQHPQRPSYQPKLERLRETCPAPRVKLPQQTYSEKKYEENCLRSEWFEWRNCANAHERAEKRFNPILPTALPLICPLDKQNRQLRWLTRKLLHVSRKRLLTIHADYLTGAACLQVILGLLQVTVDSVVELQYGTVLGPDFDPIPRTILQ